MKQKYVKPDIRFVPLHDQPDLMEEWLRHHVEEGEELAQERDGVERIQISGILGGELIVVVCLGAWPMPDAGRIVAHGVALESFQVVDDGHEVDERLAGIAGQAEPSHHQQGEDEQGG